MVNDAIDIDDIEQLRLLQEGQSHAFRMIYDRYSVFVYRRVLYLVRIEQVAQELTQDVFVRLWEKRHLVDPAKPVSPYLAKIAANLVVDFFRRAARDRRWRASLCGTAEMTGDNADERLIAADESTLLQRAIGCLPTQQQSVFKLCKVDGLSHEEVSDKLGISISTVNNHIVRANKTVKRYLMRFLPVVAPFYLVTHLVRIFFTRM